LEQELDVNILLSLGEVLLMQAIKQFNIQAHGPESFNRGPYYDMPLGKEKFLHYLGLTLLKIVQGLASHLPI
jgi:hypothetical protein